MMFVVVGFCRENIIRPTVINTLGPIKINKNIYIDERFDTEDLLIISQAIKEWEWETKGIVKFKIYPINTSADYLTLIDPDGIAITKMESDDIYVRLLDKALGNVLGFYTRRFNIPLIVIVEDRIEDNEEFHQVILHELGHSVGLEHMRKRYTLMYPSVEYGAFDITKDDLKQFCEIYFCDEEKLLKN